MLWSGIENLTMLTNFESCLNSLVEIWKLIKLPVPTFTDKLHYYDLCFGVANSEYRVNNDVLSPVLISMETYSPWGTPSTKNRTSLQFLNFNHLHFEFAKLFRHSRPKKDDRPQNFHFLKSPNTIIRTFVSPHISTKKCCLYNYDR